MADILRGEVRWADLNPVRGSEQGGYRPVLILSQDIFNERSGTVIALAITSQPQKANFPLTFELNCSELPKRSWVKISQIRTLAVERIGNKIAKVSPEELAQIIDGFFNESDFFRHILPFNALTPS
jgi:mRNA interferase MazF